VFVVVIIDVLAVGVAHVVVNAGNAMDFHGCPSNLVDVFIRMWMLLNF
jgi:hypothetical protein